MEKKSTLEEVIAVVAKQLNKKPEAVKATSRIVEDLGADSLDVIDMLMALEDSHKVAVPDEIAMNLKTVQDVADYLDSALGV